MPAFGRDEMLERDAISDVTEFVLSLSGADHNLEAAARGSEVFAADCSGCHGRTPKVSALALQISQMISGFTADREKPSWRR